MATRPYIPIWSMRAAFWMASSKLRPIAMTSPTDFISEPIFLETRPNFLRSPAWDLDDDVVEGRLETGRCGLGDGIRELGKRAAEDEPGGHEGQGITRRLGGQGRASRQPGVDFDDPVIAVLGIEGVLDVALADDPQVADGAEGDLAEPVVLGVGPASATAR